MYFSLGSICDLGDPFFGRLGRFSFGDTWDPFSFEGNHRWAQFIFNSVEKKKKNTGNPVLSWNPVLGVFWVEILGFSEMKSCSGFFWDKILFLWRFFWVEILFLWGFSEMKSCSCGVFSEMKSCSYGFFSELNTCSCGVFSEMKSCSYGDFSELNTWDKILFLWGFFSVEILFLWGVFWDKILFLWGFLRWNSVPMGVFLSWDEFLLIHHNR